MKGDPFKMKGREEGLKGDPFKMKGEGPRKVPHPLDFISKLIKKHKGEKLVVILEIWGNPGGRGGNPPKRSENLMKT